MIDLAPEQRALILRVLAELAPDCAVWAFGSRVQGEAKPWSDLDLALEAPEPLGFRRLGRLQEAFQASELPFRIDLVDLRTVTPAFRERIAREGELLRPSP